ncbi:ABC transporter ATP-binding protein [Hypericibacter sp.]|uniref:ABC transporter ATP-binding protein n=1 Tax=Hypericibacter sp. TaxID=2705401 RepID=UPI003D6D3967
MTATVPSQPGDAVALEVAGISKSFGSVTALEEVSFQLLRGEFLTMLGPSGSGKTTTLRIIAGFEAPDRGEVRLHGRDVVGVPAYERNIGMVFQDYALFPHMSVAENIGFPLEARKVGRDERRRRVEAMLAVVGLKDFGDRRPRQLSGGQQQRVALARALVFDPEIVLLDEPLGALDKKLRGVMQLEILRIAKSLGTTVISVTHDQEEALVMSDRIALFSQGRLVQIGTPRQLYEHPQTSFVADFIGESNLLQGRYAAATRQIVGTGWHADLPPGNEKRAAPAAGEAMTLVVRPENLAIRPLGNSQTLVGGTDARPNRCAGTVRDAIYLGVEFRLVVALPDGSLIQARNRELKQMEACRPGAAVELSWLPIDCVALCG